MTVDEMLADLRELRQCVTCRDDCQDCVDLIDHLAAELEKWRDRGLGKLDGYGVVVVRQEWFEDGQPFALLRPIEPPAKEEEEGS